MMTKNVIMEWIKVAKKNLLSKILGVFLWKRVKKEGTERTKHPSELFTFFF